MNNARARRTILALLAFGAAAASTLVLAGSAGATSLSGVTTGGSNAAAAACATAVLTAPPPTYSWSGTLGCFTDGTGPEPLDYSFLTATASGSGTINFRFRFRTTDTISFDWVEVRLDGSCVAPSPSCRYNPNPTLGNLFDSGTVNVSIPVTTGGSHSLFIGVRQDAFGDEASLDFSGLKGNLQLVP